MRRRLLVTVITAALAACAVAVSASANNGAHKTSLNDNVSSASCDGAVDGTPGESFAVIKRDSNGTASAQVELKHALPNTTYRVNLIQGGCSSQTAPFVTTDVQGNASIHLSAPQTSNTASVLANSHGAPDSKQTPEVTLGQ